MKRYLRLGAGMRLLRAMGRYVLSDMRGVVSVAEQDKLVRLFLELDWICLKLEEGMFDEYPWLEEVYRHVFFGELEKQDAVDEQVVSLAKEIADELFKRA